MPTKARLLPLTVILALYLVLGLAYTIINPVLEGPDEILNYQNIRFIAEQKSLDVLREGELSKAHHPPLYYIIGALATGWVSDEHLDTFIEQTNPFWAYRSWEPGVDNKSLYLHDPTLEGWPYQDVSLGVHLMRWLSLLLGAGAIIAIYLTARDLVPREPWLAWGAAALVAFNPMFLYIEGSVHNDALTNLFAALIILGSVRYWLHGPSSRRAAFIGLVGGLGILTKITFLFLGPAVALIIVVRNWSSRKTDPLWIRQLLRDLAVGGGVVLLIAGWWFVRNQMIYGEPTSMGQQAQVWGIRENAPDVRGAIRELGFLRDSFWGVFGYGQILMPGWVHNLTRLLWIVAGGGFLLWFVRSMRTKTKPYRVVSTALTLLLIVAPLTAFGATFARMTVSATANFGRYLFTTYAVLAPLIVLGLSEWAPAKWRRIVVILLSGFFLVYSVGALLWVLRPAYASPPIYQNLDAVEIEHRLDVDYPGLAKLLGYSLSPEIATPGGTVMVTLFWQVTGTTDDNYVEFVQFVQEKDQVVGGRDTHGGLGRYPTSRWLPGQIIADTIPVPIDYLAEGPDGLRLDIGLHLDGKRLRTAEGENTIRAGIVRLEAREPQAMVPISTGYQLGGLVELIAVESPPATVSPGIALPYSLTWAALEQPDTDYSVFVHLLDPSGQIIEQYDGPPLNGTFPTSLWRTGDIVLDARMMDLPADLAAGTYQVVIGWYNPDTLARLPITNLTEEAPANGALPVFEFDVID